MTSVRLYHYRDHASVFLGLEELRKQGLTPRGILFIALDPRGETHIAVPEDLDQVTSLRVGDKLSLDPPFEGRFFYFDAIHRLPGGTILWNGDRRLHDAGSAGDVAMAVCQWLRGMSTKNLFLGCTPHQPGSWWTHRVDQPITALHARGFVDAVVCNSGLLARRIGEPKLYFLPWKDLAQTGALNRWEPVYTSPLGNILLLERRLMQYRLALTCERGIVELDVSGVPDVAEAATVAMKSGFGVVGRVDGGAFAVTSGRPETWGFADLEPAMLVGSPNESLLDLGRALAASAKAEAAADSDE